MMIEFGPDPASDPGAGSTRRNSSVVPGTAIVITHHMHRWGERPHDWSVSDLRVHFCFHPQKRFVVEKLLRDPRDPICRSPEVRVPSGCEEFEIWFQSFWFTGTGDQVERWDSRYGSNYRFKTAYPGSGGGVF